jgi:DNA-binding winged helix-turn-helix (wHTH) protein
MDVIFGDFRLRTRERELVAPAGAVELSAPAFDLLRALLARPDTLLDKDSLFAAAWPGVVVEDNTLQVHISALRKALGPGLIATVHGRGYRYTGPPPHEAGDPPTPANRTLGNIDRFRTDCVARDGEAEAVCALVQQHRLVSLVGPGGVGKTTLAIDVIARLERPAGGAWMIDLAAIDSGAFIESTLIQTLALPFRAGSDALRTFIEHLRRDDALLIFDNCEHVVADAARPRDQSGAAWAQ